MCSILCGECQKAVVVHLWSKLRLTFPVNACLLLFFVHLGLFRVSLSGIGRLLRATDHALRRCKWCVHERGLLSFTYQAPTFDAYQSLRDFRLGVLSLSGIYIVYWMDEKSTGLLGSTYSLPDSQSHLDLFIVFLICGISSRRQWINLLAAHSVDRSLLSDGTNERVAGTCIQFDAQTGFALRNITHREHVYATRNAIARITCLDQVVHSSLSLID